MVDKHMADQSTANLPSKDEKKTDREWKEFFDEKKLTKKQREYLSKNCWPTKSILRGRLKAPIEDRTLDNHLNTLENLGIVIRHQKEGKSPNSKGGTKHWELSDATVKKLIEEGKKVDNKFERHLQNAIDFYSRSYILGEVGNFLLDRIDPKFESRIYLKAEYFMQSLNDYNLIDLWEAISEKKWCYIKYRHAIRKKKKKIAVLCYPLEIRVSSTSGRQMLMYYEPFKRCCSAFRLEFIDEIYYYSEQEIKEILKDASHREVVQYLDQDIKNARELLKHTWGVSMPVPQENNVVTEPNLHHVKLSIQYDPDKEYYLLNRMNRECRGGKVTVLENQIDFEIDVVDTKEMRPWIRGFYTRIIACEGLESNRFSFKEDIKELNDQFEKNILEKREKPPAPPKVTWKVPDEVQKILEEKKKKASAHIQIFNSIFSIYSYLAAEKIENENEKKESKYASKLGKMTVELIKSRYSDIWKNVNFDKAEIYKDIVPLTKIEIRWLKTILQDHRIDDFLSQNEIKVMKEWLDEKPYEALKMDDICYYDRYIFPEESLKKEQEIFTTLLDGIYNEEILSITYDKNTTDGEITGKFKPVIVEFSKRNNCFQTYVISCEDNNTYRMNVSRIKEIKNEGEKFNWEDEKKRLDNSRESSQFVEVEFWDTLNIPDRILTEFSPWKKKCKCTHDENDKAVYRLKIYYQKDDEKELVIRLMGYGANIRFTNENHPILREIRKRMNAQLEYIVEEEAES